MIAEVEVMAEQVCLQKRRVPSFFFKHSTADNLFGELDYLPFFQIVLLLRNFGGNSRDNVNS